VTVAVVTVAVGEKYQQFLPDWAFAISQLNTRPDEIIIIGDPIPDEICLRIDAQIRDWTWIHGTRAWTHHPQVMANDAIAFARSDWICKMDADDMIFPHALDHLKDLTCDVSMFGISVNGERHVTPPPVTAHEILACPHNLLFAGSPFRRDLWERTPGFQDMIYDDWAFWRSCARAGATFQRTGTIDYLYRLHDSNASSDVDHTEEVQRVLSAFHKRMDT
jgi:hypothetical protein